MRWLGRRAALTRAMDEKSFSKNGRSICVQGSVSWTDRMWLTALQLCPRSGQKRFQPLGLEAGGRGQGAGGLQLWTRWSSVPLQHGCLYSYDPRNRTRKKNRGQRAKVQSKQERDVPRMSHSRVACNRQLHDVELEIFGFGHFGPVSSSCLNTHACLEDLSEDSCLQRLSERFVGRCTRLLHCKFNLPVAVLFSET